MPATKRAFSSRPALISTTPRFLPGPEAEELEQVIHAKIRDRAYALFEESGRAPGNEDANWLRAESEVLRSDLHVRESGSWVALSASLADASGEDIQIAVRPTRVLIRARTERHDSSSPEAGERPDSEIVLAAHLQSDVDPQSASGSFRDKNLLVMIRKLRLEPLGLRSTP